MKPKHNIYHIIKQTYPPVIIGLEVNGDLVEIVDIMLED